MPLSKKDPIQFNSVHPLLAFECVEELSIKMLKAPEEGSAGVAGDAAIVQPSLDRHLPEVGNIRQYEGSPPCSSIVIMLMLIFIMTTHQSTI